MSIQQNQPDTDAVATPKRRNKLALMVRSFHFYASAFVAVMILFYAVTGFLATHADWFAGEEHAPVIKDQRPIPERALQSDEALHAWCASLLGADARVMPGFHDGLEQWFLVRGEERALQCVVNRSAAEARVIALVILPAGAPADHQLLADSIAMELGADVDEESFYHDEAFQTLHFSVASVWFEAHVSVFLDQRLYSVERHDVHFIRSLVELHRGQHSNAFQTFLADLTAVLLVFVIVSGLVMGMQMNKRRRMTVIALVVSTVLTVALIVCR